MTGVNSPLKPKYFISKRRKTGKVIFANMLTKQVLRALVPIFEINKPHTNELWHFEETILG